VALLDRDRMPVRFSVVTSVLSGLIVAISLKALSVGLAGGFVVLWGLLPIGGAAVAGLALGRIRGRHPQVFLMVSTFSRKYQVSAFVQHLHNSLDRNGIDLVLKAAEREFDASAQSHHLSRILSRRSHYLGGVITPAEVDRLRDDLVAFCRNFRKPIVFTDLEPFDKVEEYPENTAYIGYDTGRLGELAGEWLAKKLRDKNRPHVLIIAGHEHSARQRRCEDALRSALPDVDLVIDAGCEFIRSRAHVAVRAHIQRLPAGQHLDAIYCTSDEMALGAVDALRPPSPVTEDTLVIGTDGITEVKELIQTAQSPLKATVVQDEDRLAWSIVDLLRKMCSGRPVPKRTILPGQIHEAP